MRTAGRQPRILLTNVKQLELLLTRQQDVELFAGARLDFLVFDEAHTFTGALGAETACLVRRLRAFCQADPARTTCIATSATIVDHGDPEAGRTFAARFFGVASDAVTTVGEDYETEVWAEPRFVPRAPADRYRRDSRPLRFSRWKTSTSAGGDVRADLSRAGGRRSRRGRLAGSAARGAVPQRGRVPPERRAGDAAGPG